jgi:mono/diheme cytochrome c family protein
MELRAIRRAGDRMNSSRNTRLLIGLAVMCLALPAGVVHLGARAVGVATEEAPQASSGRDLFVTYCASCHGVTGAGNGPAASAMRQRPPDLTGLAIANGGMFPAERVRRIIDGRDVESHGDRDMPVWGDAFKSTGGGRSEESVRQRITLILELLMSIQRRQA